MFIYTWLVPWQNEPHIIPGSAHLVVHLPPVFSLRWGRGSLIAKKKHQLFKLLNHKSKEPSLVTTDHSAVYSRLYIWYIWYLDHSSPTSQPFPASLKHFHISSGRTARPRLSFQALPKSGPWSQNQCRTWWTSASCWGSGIWFWDLVTNKGLKRQSNPDSLNLNIWWINIQGTPANMILFDMPLSCMSK